MDELSRTNKKFYTSKVYQGGDGRKQRTIRDQCNGGDPRQSDLRNTSYQIREGVNADNGVSKLGSMTNNSNALGVTTSPDSGFCSGSGSWSCLVIQRLTDCQNGIRCVVVISLSSLWQNMCPDRCRRVSLGMFRTTRCPVTASKGVQLYGGCQIRM